MSNFRRRLFSFLSNAIIYDIDTVNPKLLNTSLWVDNESWSATNPSVLSVTSGRCCYPVYISCNPNKTYQFTMSGTVSGAYCRVLDSNKNIIKSIQAYQAQTFTGSNYVVVFSINPLSTYITTLAAGNYIYFKEV